MLRSHTPDKANTTIKKHAPVTYIHSGARDPRFCLMRLVFVDTQKDPASSEVSGFVSLSPKIAQGLTRSSLVSPSVFAQPSPPKITSLWVNGSYTIPADHLPTGTLAGNRWVQVTPFHIQVSL